MCKVYLVGAGPGDEGLITIKGLEKLRECDAVVYDRLAAEELLKYVRSDCEKIYVGKETGKHYKKQEEINRILVECARTHNITVRLKGGDPFVFGRGGEEIEALAEHGIPYEVIPGVTSAVAVPECAGIPVTHRGVSRSFHVLTGHTKTSAGSPDYDYQTLAKLEGTLVFLMGISNLAEIVEKLVQAGKDAATPAAVISNGTMPEQQIAKGKLGDIAEKVKERNMLPPAVVVIGETAKLEYLNLLPDVTGKNNPREKELYADSLKSMKCVGITATDLLWKKLKAGFEEMGMQPISLCEMKVVAQQMKKLRKELHHLNQYQWVMFTSQNAVCLFFAEMCQAKVDIRTLGNMKFAVLGSGTAAKLSEYGIRADFIPSEYTVSVLAREFAEIVKPTERVLIPRAVQGSPELTSVLKKEQIAYTDIPIYDVVGSMTENICCLEDLTYLVFVSASGVTAFFEALEKRNLTIPDTVKIVCIGEMTKRKILEKYGRTDVVPTVNSVEGLLEAVKRFEEVV